jgi:hypothetical protein
MNNYLIIDRIINILMLINVYIIQLVLIKKEHL